jgi:hypothetical protein
MVILRKSKPTSCGDGLVTVPHFEQLRTRQQSTLALENFLDPRLVSRPTSILMEGSVLHEIFFCFVLEDIEND